MTQITQMTRLLIRHGMTAGNLEGRYIGCRTDEPLCQEGILALREKRSRMKRMKQFPPISRVYSSPMRRCLETAALLYPDVSPEIIEDFCECDFGDFEGHSYAELNGNWDYQRWVDSGGRLPFPGGESRESFSARCVRAYKALPPCDCVLIVHGGTIMAIMEAFARPIGDDRGKEYDSLDSRGNGHGLRIPRRDFYDFQVPCGEGYELHGDGSYKRLP